MPNSDQFFLIPRPGVIVLDPRSMRPLEEAGEWKPRTPYWQRRLNDEDVTEGTPPPPAHQH